VGGHLKADLARIAQVSRQVEQLAHEFGQAATLAQGYEPALGDAGLAGTLHSFATAPAGASRKRRVTDGPPHR
jgi:hypothetical protein